MNPEPNTITGAEPAAPASFPANGTPPYQLRPEDLPDLDTFVIETLDPVDNIFIEKQGRLLTEPLHSCWTGPGSGRTFQAFADVGLFYDANNKDGLAPDVMLAVDIPVGGDLSQRPNRSYFAWLRGKSPDVVIEFVSDKRGREEDFKYETYARIGVPYYVIFDPREKLHHGVLRAFVRQGGSYQPLSDLWFPDVGLGIRLWQGDYEGHNDRWLRWYDRQGDLIPTGIERALQVERQLQQEHQRADEERQRADEERQRREQLEARLRALGVDPDAPN